MNRSSEMVHPAFGRKAFTLIELLVVISIIAILIGILLPALGAARSVARGSQSLSNQRQIGIASNAYNTEYKGYFPVMSSGGTTPTVTFADSTSEKAKPRWVDYYYDYVSVPEVYRSPNIESMEWASRFKILFWREVSNQNALSVGADSTSWNYDTAAVKTGLDAATVKRHGGFGYNFQFLGNSRQIPGDPLRNKRFNANLDTHIKAPSETFLAGDTYGAPSTTGEGIYAIDPPVGSRSLGSLGSRRTATSHYYANSSETADVSFTGSDPADNVTGTNSDDVVADSSSSVWVKRSVPAMRNRGAANMVFVDGHAKAMKLSEIDDSNGDGKIDMGFWNGLGRNGAGRR